MFSNKGFGISGTNEICALFSIHKISFASSYLDSNSPASLGWWPLGSAVLALPFTCTSCTWAELGLLFAKAIAVPDLQENEFVTLSAHTISHWLGASANSKRLNVLKIEQRISISILSEMTFLCGGLNSLDCCGPSPVFWKQRNVNVFCYTHSSVVLETQITPHCAWQWGVDYFTLTIKMF